MQLQLEGNPKPTSLFSFAVRNAQGQGKVCLYACKGTFVHIRILQLHVIELGLVPEGNSPFTKKNADTYYAEDAAADFPVAMQVHRCSQFEHLHNKVVGCQWHYLSGDEVRLCAYVRRGNGHMHLHEQIQSRNNLRHCRQSTTQGSARR